MVVYALQRRDRLDKKSFNFTSFHILNLYSSEDVANEDLLYLRSKAIEEHNDSVDFGVFEF